MLKDLVDFASPMSAMTRDDGDLGDAFCIRLVPRIGGRCQRQKMSLLFLEKYRHIEAKRLLEGTHARVAQAPSPVSLRDMHSRGGYATRSSWGYCVWKEEEQTRSLFGGLLPLALASDLRERFGSVH